MIEKQTDFNPPIPLREAARQAKYDRLDLIVYAPGDIPGEEETIQKQLSCLMRATMARLPIEKALRRYGDNLCYSIADYADTKTTSCICASGKANRG